MATPLLKRFVCTSCGATGPMPPRSPFVQCRSCGIISDFDLGVFRRHPDWPRHEALHHALLQGAREELEAAVQTNDHARCARAHARIVDELITQCPNAYPQRLADAAYRAQWLAFQGSHLASLMVDPELVAGGRAVAEGVARIMKVAWTTDVLMPVFDIAVKHFEAQDRSVARRGFPPPPDFVRGWMRRVGISMTVQEWLPRIPLAEQLTLVARMGVANEYVAPGSADSVRCGGCGAATSASALECAACKRALDHARGAFDCGSCGVRVHLAKGSEQAVCPFCSAHMRESRAGLEDREEQRAAFRFIDRELRMACDELTGGAAPIRFDVLDGPVTRRDLPWRRVMLRACFANARDQDFFENTDYPDASSHAETDAWLAAQKQVKGIPHRVLRTREHPRCTQNPSAEELEARRTEIDPARTGRVHVVRHGPIGAGVEIHLADEIVVLAFDDDDGDHVRRVATALGWWIQGSPVAK